MNMKIKKMVWKYLFFLMVIFFKEVEANIFVTNKKKDFFTIELFVPELIMTQDFVETIKKDCEYSSQCLVSVQSFSNNLEEKIQAYSGNALVGIGIALHKKQIQAFFYDLLQKKVMKTVSFSIDDTEYYVIAHKIAYAFWSYYMNQSSSFLSYISFCKKEKGDFDHKKKYSIHVTDFIGMHFGTIYETKDEIFLPKWVDFSYAPILFFSKNGKKAIFQQAINFFGVEKIFSHNTMKDSWQSAIDFHKKAILTVEYKNTHSQLYVTRMHDKKNILLADLEGLLFDPCYIDDTKLCFLTTMNSKTPYIALLHLKTQKIEEITCKNDFCGSLCIFFSKIAYVKKIHGYFQVFVYDVQEKKHTQITFDSFHHDELSWSPCGNFIVCSRKNNEHSSVIAVIHLATKKIYAITGQNEYCYAPSWSNNFLKY